MAYISENIVFLPFILLSTSLLWYAETDKNDLAFPIDCVLAPDLIPPMCIVYDFQAYVQ